MSGVVGFIGLGSQGGPMAHRIVDAGLRLAVWARRIEAMEPYAAKGAIAAETIAQLGAQCDHVGVCVVNDADVEQVCGQLIPAMRSGSRLVIHSTIHPDHCADLDKRCGERGIGFLDAPVSGGGPAAEAGVLTAMCGGAQSVFDAARPVFETFAKLIVRLGDAGAGQRAKIVNNALLAANMGMAHAACAAADALGLDRSAFGDLIRESSGRSFGFEIYARLPSPAAFAVGAPLLFKDVGLLNDILVDNPAARDLTAAGEPFLEATGQ